MKILSLYFVLSLAILPSFGFGQGKTCLHKDLLSQNKVHNPKIEAELDLNEDFISNFLSRHSASELQSMLEATYTIPVVIHVFHDGNNAKLDIEQIQSGLDKLNEDIQGRNPDFDDVDPIFEDRKASLNIEFCLAKINPMGNEQIAINYYNDADKMLNRGNLFEHAWDNRKYLNFYLPKYTAGAPSMFTAFAYYPSDSNVENNTGGVFYSSIRWGYGQHSELDEGQEWASVITHEIGHWLNLRHTFNGGCNATGDFVADTPPTLGGTLYANGCKNQNFSCGESTNGSNYMDYNIDCKKMFTEGQVMRMLAALHFNSRKNLWSDENLISTGCKTLSDVNNIAPSARHNLFPNPAADILTIQSDDSIEELRIYTIDGSEIYQGLYCNKECIVDVNRWENGIYLYTIKTLEGLSSGRFLIQHN